MRKAWRESQNSTSSSKTISNITKKLWWHYWTTKFRKKWKLLRRRKNNLVYCIIFKWITWARTMLKKPIGWGLAILKRTRSEKYIFWINWNSLRITNNGDSKIKSNREKGRRVWSWKWKKKRKLYLKDSLFLKSSDSSAKNNMKTPRENIIPSTRLLEEPVGIVPLTKVRLKYLSHDTQF